jgi:post-segregation antitoxin (ccd killing protein)
MAKLSISVPDQLWERARAVDADKNPSQLVQDALARFVADRQTDFAAAPAAESEGIAAIAQQKRAEAEELYLVGYRAGADLAKKWPWEVLDWASQLDFDLGRLQAEDEDSGDLVYPDGRVEDDILDADGWRRGRLFELGRQHALRDVWKAVTERSPEPRSDRSKETS